MSYTGQLATYICESRPQDIPKDVRHEAKRALLNIVGCALGGAEHRAVDIAIEAIGPFSGPPTSAVLGRRERFDPLFAALLNGISTHVHDYDDTLPKNYIHASSPVAAALFAYASANKVAGADFLHAFILGFEVISRIGNATYPAHYLAGWHSTGSIGVFGAAIAVGKLQSLTSLQTANAIGLAATQSAGLREMFGSMAKSFHPGRSAQSGYMAALLAQKGFTAALLPLEGPRGFAAVQAGSYDFGKIVDSLGVRFELHDNTYKPFPSGLVIHPTIDACIQLRDKHNLTADQIASVQLRVAPLVKDLCNKKAISTGLEAKFSIYHAAAIGLGRGKGGLAEFTDEAANDPTLRALRDITDARVDPDIGEDAVAVSIRLKDGRGLGMKLEGSLGNLERPLSDAQLEAKFREQGTVISSTQMDEVIAACWNIEAVNDVANVIAACIPKGDRRASRSRQ
ncbi:MmgE/PrpD family protein [Bradyrhizobium sp. LHD-71]|uniref:MmgE/PrpD family protein n=1 Tax=Bradyrhizobium sp. LHD-71 TaxID=3072141 RepID=UPI00280E7816|nr:MmgE/PrpD family protein [Bradyrhizobium sp. LHD-71]MDQ8727396.1 MmgE/PrpD family protein [Bradyrhizobium sp. LHD-71]